MNPIPAINVRRLTVKYHDTFEPVIHNVSFAVPPASLTMLIGPNGSGKTTLIKAMLGLIPYQGTIEVAGRDLEMCQHAIGYVPQTHTVDLNFPMTVSEFLQYSHANCTDSSRGVHHIQTTLNTIGGKALWHKNIGQLSGGQLQRVLLARAIMHRPQILILDEPETGIDVGGEQTLYDLLLRLKQESMITVFVATHEIDLVHRYADQVLCLNRQIICEGKPAKVLTPKTLHQLYGYHYHYQEPA